MVEIAGAANAALAALSNQAVEVKPYGVASYVVDVVFERQYAEVETAAGYAPTLQGLWSELDPNGCVDQRAEVWIAGDLYRVAAQEIDAGTDYVRWQLERDPLL